MSSSKKRKFAFSYNFISVIVSILKSACSKEEKVLNDHDEIFYEPGLFSYTPKYRASNPCPTSFQNPNPPHM